MIGIIRKFAYGFLFAFRRPIILWPNLVLFLRWVIGRKSRFFHTPWIRRSDTRGSLSEYCHNVW